MNQPTGGYTPKDLNFNEEAQSKLINGITKIASAVKSTLGPMGQTVLIESPQHLTGLTVTKDGITVATAVDCCEPVENLAVKILTEDKDKHAT